MNRGPHQCAGVIERQLNGARDGLSFRFHGPLDVTRHERDGSEAQAPEPERVAAG